MGTSISKMSRLRFIDAPEGDPGAGGSGAPADQDTDEPDERSEDRRGIEPGDDPSDVYSDPEKARANPARLRRENASQRTRLREAEAEAKAQADRAAAILKAAGLAPEDNTPDPTADAKAALASERAELARERYVLRNATKHGLNPDALVDSRAFMASIMGIDPADSDALDAKLTEAKNNSAYRARSAGPSTPDVPVGGQPADTSSLTGQALMAAAYAKSSRKTR